jgi:hypothetical protein|tara:strand:- start:968 stop:1144 length:177 start_codon:yes stop_codon:yes gene_type:complete
MTQVDRRKKVSKPKVFNEQRESMLLIKSASPADIYIWCLSIVIIFAMLTFMVTTAYFN